MSLVEPNIFDYIGKKNDEKNIHEKFIASLLKDNEKFGKLIWNNIKSKIKQFASKEYERIKDEDINCFSVAEQYKIGARPTDIFFRTKQGIPVILELKIDAPDQDAQLWDYYTVAEQIYNKEPLVFYVTLNSNPENGPKDESIKPLLPSPDNKKESPYKKTKNNKNILKKNEEYFHLTYKDLLGNDTINGIESKKEENRLSFLFEEYKKLIKELTDQHNNCATKRNFFNPFIISVLYNLKKLLSLPENDYEFFKGGIGLDGKKTKIATHIEFSNDVKIADNEECFFKVNIRNKPGKLVIYHRIYNSEDLILYGIFDETVGWNVKAGKEEPWHLADYKSFITNIIQQKRYIYVNTYSPKDWDKKSTLFKGFDNYLEQPENNPKRLPLNILFAQYNDISGDIKYESDIPDFARIFASWVYNDYYFLNL